VTRESEWQLALPLTLAYAAFFLVPLGLLIAVSAFGDDRITTLDGRLVGAISRADAEATFSHDHDHQRQQGDVENAR